jgi:lipid A 3-O-deacylase
VRDVLLIHTALRISIVRILPCALLPALGSPKPLAAQAVEAATLRLDNDILALRGREAPPDYDYTHGLHASVELNAAPGWGALVPAIRPCPADEASGSCARTRLRMGQEIYTPRRDAPTPLPGERPYAAWLYLGADALVAGPRRQRSATVELGVTGPPALGEPVQNGLHALLGSERQVGWAHQIGFEPGIRLGYAEEYRFSRGVPGVGVVRVVPGWSASLGNVRTAAQAGVSAGVRRGSGRGAELGVGAYGEWVGRDLFLDGGTFRSSSLARKLPFVARGEIRAGYALRRWSVEYAFVVRSRQYRAQPGPHRYGSLSLAWRPR